MIYTSPKITVPNLQSVLRGWESITRQLLDLDNIYFTVATHTIVAQAKMPCRTASTFLLQEALAWDIDKADTTQAVTYAWCVGKILEVDPAGLTVVNSGNGLHIYAYLKNPIRSVTYFKNNKAAYDEICLNIDSLIEDQRLPGKCDVSIFEPARLLRVPGTKNKKPGLPEKSCFLVQAGEIEHEIDLMEISGIERFSRENIVPTDIRRNYPLPDFKEIMQECEFMKWATHAPEELHEFHKFDYDSILHVQDQNATIEYDGRQVKPKQLSELIHDKATGSPSLSRANFEVKWSQAGKYGARRCETIQSRSNKCVTCKWRGKVPTPLALRSKNHIGSESAGFWVINKDGAPTHPHYGDLARVYGAATPLVVTSDERILAFKDTHYVSVAPIQLKGWLETVLIPSDPLKEPHRQEFVHKVKAAKILQQEQEDILIHKSVRGKLNCKNGILDLVTSSIYPHSPKFGFRAVLPYDYVVDQASEYFLDWLANATEYSYEIMESLLDVMAYLLWPDYDDHIFIFLTGSGGNGKSTFINILKALVGEGNYTSLNTKQITKNRFAVSDLEGKMFNLSEESGDYEITHEEMNVIKNLSSGGHIYIERKNTQGYVMHNKAKLLFSANKIPRVLEKSDAVRRRLLVLPFNFKIKNADPRIEERLCGQEIPAIMSMLTRRIQENIAQNDGVFKVYRGGVEAAAAQEEFLNTGDTSIQWAKEMLESGEHVLADDFVHTGMAYTKYKSWCEDNGYRNAANKNTFSKSIRSGFISKLVLENDAEKWVHGKNITVFKRTRYKEGAE